MNPTNWMMPLYKAVGVQHPILSTIGICAVTSIFFGGWWFLTGLEYRDALAKNQQIPSKVNISSAPSTPQPSQEQERSQIVEQLVEKYKTTHQGTLPPIAWLNKRLEAQGRDFRITPPVTPRRGMTFDGVRFEGNGTAVSNSDPSAQFTFHDTEFINNNRAIVNAPASPQDKKENPKEP
jgi:hypothetical protein